jgi:hypothetical protein
MVAGSTTGGAGYQKVRFITVCAVNGPNIKKKGQFAFSQGVNLPEEKGAVPRDVRGYVVDGWHRQSGTCRECVRESS